MNIFSLANRLILIFLVGLFVLYIPLTLHGIPLGDINYGVGDAFVVGLLIVLFSYPIFENLRFMSIGYAEVVSIIFGGVIIAVLLYLFPFYLPEYKILEVKNISVTKENLDTVREEVLEKGKSVFFVDKGIWLCSGVLFWLFICFSLFYKCF